MAELTTLARPYAKAAFESAREAGDLQGWSDALTLLASVSLSEKIDLVLDSPNLNGEQKAEVFIEICGEKLNEKQKNFVKVLAENKRLGLLVPVQEQFELYKANIEKSVDVDIQAAFEISPELQQKIAQALAKKLDREVTLQTSVDTSLLGGALIRAGDTVIDGSVKGRLAKLAEAMGV
ncbi:ATP synthase subunit delta [Thalassocella blandensis]|nr:ATP synthase subunit delta [Thalassocella blandensis]